MARNLFVVFDLDGTLALNDHREHFLTGAEKDWRGFYAACDGDSPCAPLVSMAHTLVDSGHRVEIWSGRSDEVADKTTAWLAQHGLDGIPIKMREARDHQPDTKLKLSWLRACDRAPDMIFDDRASVVAMWREQGVLCAQVAPGDF